MRPIRVLSLFDGMSCGQIALRDLGFPVEKYYASEIDKFAIQQTQLNFPDTVQLGDVRNIDVDKLCDEVGEFDLLLAGSPCQSFSFAGKRVGMKTKENMEILTLGQYLDLKEADFEFEGQSYLFWEFMRVLTVLRRRNPNIMFLLENVEMGKKWETVLSEAVGIRGVHINSALVSAQNRRRIYWTNIRVREEGLFGYKYTDIPQPADRGILLRDILEKEVDEKYYLKDEVVRNLLTHKERNKNAGNGFGAVFHKEDSKMGAVKVGGSGMDDLVLTNNHLQKNLTDVDGKANSFLATSHKGAWANGMSLVRTPIQLNESTESGGKQPYQQNRVYDVNGLAPAVMANLSCGSYAIYENMRIRRITPTECARLQTIPEWYKWECVKKYIDINLCELNVELTAAKYILQTKRPDYVICTILGSSEQVQLMKDQKLINQKNAQWTVAIDNVPHISDYASCTIKGLRGMEQQTLSNFSLNMKRYVLYVEKLSTEEMEVQKDYAQNIIAVLKFTEIQVRLIKGTKNEKIILEFVDICQRKEECQRIERFMKITLAENCKDMNVFIISILIKQIIGLRTCIFSNLKMSTKKLMLSFQLSPLNLSSVALLNLRMGIIESTSETRQYMMLGNGWTVEVIKHILSFMKLEDTV